MKSARIVHLDPATLGGLAAVLNGHVPGVAGKRVGVTLSGGNVGAARFAELVGAGS